MKKQTHKWSIYCLLEVLCTLVFLGVSMANPLDDLKKVGEAKLKVLFWDVYNSSLYSKKGALEFRVDVCTKHWAVLPTV